MKNEPGEEQPYVFISYPRAESLLADEIVEALEKAGIRTWRDVDDIESGENWVSSIEGAIRTASAFVYLAGKGKHKSQWMMRELETLFRNRVDQTILIPVVVGSSGFDALPDIAKQFQGVDLSVDYVDGLQKIVERLKEFAGEEPAAAIPEKKNKGYAFISYALAGITST